MTNDDPNLLNALKREFQFLEEGGYRQSPDAPWRRGFIFEDSPACINYRRKRNLQPCGECLLMRFVPPDCHAETIPCRHIPLSTEGFTIDMYYRLGPQEEVETALAASFGNRSSKWNSGRMSQMGIKSD